MKSFISFVIALFAARRSFAVVVRSRVNLPAVPRPSLSQQRGVPLFYQARRHLAATPAMVQRDDEEEDVTGYPQPFIFDLPHKVLEREFYKRRLSGLSLHPKEDFEKVIYRFRSKNISKKP